MNRTKRTPVRVSFFYLPKKTLFFRQKALGAASIREAAPGAVLFLI
jgi:hypothetical protein